jgi:hypothetical protein
MISSELAALAEDPEFFIKPPEGARRISDDRFCVIVGPHKRWAGVCRLRLPAEAAEVAEAVAEVRRLVAGVDPVVWNVGSSATPEDLPARLREHGLRDPDPPLDPVVAAMALGEEPPAVGGIDVKRIETFEDHQVGLEIMLAAAKWTEKAAADERARARETFERRQRRGGLQWLAWLDDTPVAYAAADRAAAGLFLAGGATLPQARGRGCYRALVRGSLGRSCPAGRPRPGGSGAVRLFCPDPAGARLHRGRHHPHPPVVGILERGRSGTSSRSLDRPELDHVAAKHR